MNYKKCINKMVSVNFLDHAEDIEGTIKTEVHGKLVGNKKDHLTVLCWDLKGVDESTRKDNWKIFSIAKSTIKRVSYCTHKRRLT